ncbi:uncharacterized protein LOC115218395 [Argonauta hians]
MASIMKVVNAMVYLSWVFYVGSCFTMINREFQARGDNLDEMKNIMAELMENSENIASNLDSDNIASNFINDNIASNAINDNIASNAINDDIASNAINDNIASNANSDVGQDNLQGGLSCRWIRRQLTCCKRVSLLPPVCLKLQVIGRVVRIKLSFGGRTVVSATITGTVSRSFPFRIGRFRGYFNVRISALSNLQFVACFNLKVKLAFSRIFINFGCIRKHFLSSDNVSKISMTGIDEKSEDFLELEDLDANDIFDIEQLGGEGEITEITDDTYFSNDNIGNDDNDGNNGDEKLMNNLVWNTYN